MKKFSKDWWADKFGWLIGRGVVGVVKGKDEKVKETPKASKAAGLEKIAKVLVVVVLSVHLAGCTALFQGIYRGATGGPFEPTPKPVEAPQCCKDQGGVYQENGAPGRVCGEADHDCWHDPADGCDSCWKYVPPTAAPTATPTATPTQQPTRTPVVSATPTPPPAPTCVAAPPAPPAPVSMVFAGSTCPRGFEMVQYEDVWRPLAPAGHVLCVARSVCDKDGHGACPGLGDRASWAVGYNLFQGQELLFINGVYMVYDKDRGCKDAYSRFYHEKQDCAVLYENEQDGVLSPWKYNQIAPPLVCPDPTPQPTQPTPPPAPFGGMPTLYRIKVQNVDNNPNTREKYGCHNPIQGDRFSKNNWCESGSTGLYEGNEGTLPGPSGPCDPLHMATFQTICGMKEPNVVPVWTVTGSFEEWHVADNPHHVDVKFIPGSCYTICAEAPKPAFATDGSPVPVGSNTKTCATHCY